MCEGYDEKTKRSQHPMLTHDKTKSGRDRIQGFTDTIQSHNEYKIIAMEDTQGQIERSLPKVEKMVEEHEDIDVIMSLNDPTAMGALAALDSKDYKKMYLYMGLMVHQKGRD